MARRTGPGRGAFFFAVALLAVSTTGGTGGTCIDDLGNNPQIQPCSTAADCEGRVHAACAGDWACTEGACTWQCTDESPPACHAAADCEGGTHDACVGQWACAGGKCLWLCDADLSPECQSPADCEGRPHIECDGEWTCTNLGECAWTCIGAPAECIVSGCSGEVCAETSMVTICLWLDWYACLRLTTCGRLSDGSCGWLPNEAFLACMGGGKTCATNADCGEGQACVDGACVAAPSCPVVQPGTHGTCEMVLGIVFDGTRCTYESGCSCKPDCDAFFPDLATCEAACLDKR